MQLTLAAACGVHPRKAHSSAHVRHLAAKVAKVHRKRRHAWEEREGKGGRGGMKQSRDADRQQSLTRRIQRNILKKKRLYPACSAAALPAVAAAAATVEAEVRRPPFAGSLLQRQGQRRRQRQRQRRDCRCWTAAWPAARRASGARGRQPRRPRPRPESEQGAGRCVRRRNGGRRGTMRCGRRRMDTTEERPACQGRCGGDAGKTAGVRERRRREAHARRDVALTHRTRAAALPSPVAIVLVDVAGGLSAKWRQGEGERESTQGRE